VLVRIWVLYACKLSVVAVCLAALAVFLDWPLTLPVCIALVAGLGLAGALLAIIHMVFRRPIACPICGGDSALVAIDNRLGVECEHCGLVTAAPLREFRFRVDPPVDSPTDTDTES
jgi:hypothetical protein